MSRAHGPDEHFIAQVRKMTAGRPGPTVSAASAARAMPPDLALDLFEAQIASRHLDLAARELRARNQGFYTIGSSGHEANAAIAAALRSTDPAMLHYRSGAFYLQRATQVPGVDGERDILLWGVPRMLDSPHERGSRTWRAHPGASSARSSRPRRCSWSSSPTARSPRWPGS